MTNSLMLGGVYILMAVMLVLGGLMARREPFARSLTIGLAWISIFAAGFVIFTFRDDLNWVAQRLRAEAAGTPVQQAQTIRIPMAIDGHFWVDAKINGHDVKFLVDSGATMTTIGSETAASAGVLIDQGRDQMVRTGNGVVRVASGSADQLTLGPIERINMPLHIARGEDLNVLGMNYLSTLQRWGVEGRWLILQS